MSPPIVHVASGREWRGGQRQVWLLARALGRMGVDQVVITGARTELARRLKAAGIPIRPAAWRVGLDPRVLWSIVRELRLRPALLHAHDAHSVTLAGIAAAFTGSALVITRRVTFPLRRRFFWRRADRIIAISTAVRQALVDGGVDVERVVLIPSAVDLQDLSAVPRVGIRQRLGLPEKGQLAVGLGALTREKDHLTMVMAAARLVRDLPDLHWVIAGEGPLDEELRWRISELGLQGRFHLVGQMVDPHQILAEADVFVLTSTSEGLGTSVLAAMAFGVPVVASRVGGVPDLLGSGAGLLVPPRNPDEFAVAVRRVLAEPELRQRLTAAARREVRNFSIDAMAERVLSVYRSCAHSLDGS